MQNTYSDKINELPLSDKYIPTQNEVQIMNSLFKEEDGINNIINDFKDSMFLGIIFAILASPLLDKYIYKLPIPKTYGYILTIKTIIFVIISWVLQNKYLSKI